MIEKEMIKKEMKKRIKEHPILKQYVKKGIEEYHLTEDEAAEIMIEAYFDVRGIK